MIGSARFVLSRSKAIEKFRELKAISDIVSYSYKTNPEVGKVLLTHTGSMFSVHSLEELSSLGDGKRAWFFAQAWDEEEIAKAFMMGADKFVVDNINDLNALLDHLKKSKKKADLLLRMKLKEHTIHTGKHYVYGMYSRDVNALLPELRKNMGIGRLGIHFHRKTQNVSEWGIREELEDSISPESWKMIDIVNIGGGIPSEYKNFSKYVIELVFSKIKDLKQWLNSKGITMIIEPGRYIASYPVRLEARIANIYDNNIVINCSVYNSAMDTFVANIRLLVEGELGDKEGKAYTIKGCTPDSMDIFRYNVYLKDPKAGDKIVFLNAGAYTYATDFCNLPKLRTDIVD